MLKSIAPIFIHLGGRGGEGGGGGGRGTLGVKCLAQEHTTMFLARVQTRTAQSGERRPIKLK